MNKYLVTRLAHLPPSRYAKQVDAGELCLMLENHERAAEQSRRTVAGQRAEIAPRPPLRIFATGSKP